MSRRSFLRLVLHHTCNDLLSSQLTKFEFVRLQGQPLPHKFFHYFFLLMYVTVLLLQEKFGDFWPFIASNFLNETQKDMYEVSTSPHLEIVFLWATTLSFLYQLSIALIIYETYNYLGFICLPRFRSDDALSLKILSTSLWIFFCQLITFLNMFPLIMI